MTGVEIDIFLKELLAPRRFRQAQYSPDPFHVPNNLNVSFLEQSRLLMPPSHFAFLVRIHRDSWTLWKSNAIVGNGRSTVSSEYGTAAVRTGDWGALYDGDDDGDPMMP